MTRGTKRLGERETAELREAFELFDSEKSGKINLCVLAHHATTNIRNEPRAAPQARAQGPAAVKEKAGAKWRIPSLFLIYAVHSVVHAG